MDVSFQTNGAVAKQYEGCGHPNVASCNCADQVLRALGGGTRAKVEDGLHQAGHMVAVNEVTRVVPDVQRSLVPIIGAAASGELVPGLHGAHAAFVLRHTSRLLFDTGSKPSEDVIREFVAKGMGSTDLDLRTSVLACGGRATHEIDRANRDGKWSATKTYIEDQTQAFKAELSVKAPSPLRYWFVKGSSYRELMPAFVANGLYLKMLAFGDRAEVELALRAADQMATVVSDPKSDQGYVKFLRSWLPPFKEALQKLKQGGNSTFKITDLNVPAIDPFEKPNAGMAASPIFGKKIDGILARLTRA